MKHVYVNICGDTYTEDNLSRDERKFLLGILGDTRDQFRDAFIEMANSKEKKDRRKFAALYANLAELLLPKPVVSTEVDEEQFQKLVGKFEEKKGGSHD